MTITFLIYTLNRIKWYTPFLCIAAVQITAFLLIFYASQAQLPMTMPGDQRYAFSLLLFDSLHKLNALNLTLKPNPLFWANTLTFVVFIIAMFKTTVLLNLSKLTKERVWFFADGSLANEVCSIVRANKVVLNVVKNPTKSNQCAILCNFTKFEQHIRSTDTVVIAHTNDADNIALFLKIKSLPEKPCTTFMNINDLELKQGVDKLSLQNDENRSSTILVTSHLEYQLREQILHAMPQTTLNISKNLMQLNIFSSGKMLHVVLRNLVNRMHYPLKDIRIQISVFYKNGSFSVEQMKNAFSDKIHIEYVELPVTQDDMPIYLLSEIKKTKQWPSHWFFYDDKTELAMSNALMVEKQLDWLKFPPQSMSLLSNTPVPTSLQTNFTARISIPTPFAKQLSQQLNHALVLENIAEENHLEYVNSQIIKGRIKGSQSSLVDWVDLDESFKEDNRAFVDQQAMALATLNYEHALDASGSKFKSKHIEELARSEHTRWASVKHLQGWAFDEIRDDFKKLNPNVRAWEALSIESQNANIQYLADGLNDENSPIKYQHQAYLLYSSQTPVHFTSTFKKHVNKYANVKVILDIKTLPKDFLTYSKHLVIAINNEEWDALDNHIVDTLKALDCVSFWYCDGPVLDNCRTFLQQNELDFIEVQSL